ncbi:hypothetical protein Scep_009551 [Stephania cephalantha]|uniref:Uncharacterized protein n=1 Tax=Stephania cephalantha TaxID=152367 RepID=A0AAP0PGB3_9MAGN
MKLAAMSTNPMSSPPKNLFPSVCSLVFSTAPSLPPSTSYCSLHSSNKHSAMSPGTANITDIYTYFPIIKKIFQHIVVTRQLRNHAIHFNTRANILTCTRWFF